MENFIMKKLLLATACVTALGSAAFANDFDNSTFEVVATHNALTFGLVTTENDGYDSLYVGYDALSHSVGIGESYVTFGAEYFIDADQTALSVTHNTVINNGDLSFVVAPQLTYLSEESTLSDGDVYFEPTLGVAYVVNPTVGLFADVQYSWNASEDWLKSGGEVRVGADFVVASNVTLTPYVSHTFDVPSAEDSSQVGLTLGLAF